MKAALQPEPTVLPAACEGAPEPSGYALNIAGVYQDPVTRDWALQMCRTATQLAGDDWVQNTWYQVSELRDLGTLMEAVQTALRADVIVVSVHAADELPVELYVWIDAWLPRRMARAGALAALIGLAGPPYSEAARTREYLHAVARRGRLEFVPYACELPAHDAPGGS